jgi:hypothetical protein
MDFEFELETEFEENIVNATRAQMGLADGKSQSRKISCYCPINIPW